MDNVKKEWYKTWWGIFLIFIFWPILIPYLIWAKTGWKLITKIITSAVLLLIVLFGILGENEGDNNKTTTEPKAAEQPKKEVEQPKQEPKQDYTVTKDNSKGMFIIQVIVPETATETEIYRALQDTQMKVRKEFMEDNIMIVAYSDARFTYKGLLGTHGQYKLSKGIEDYMKISPKTKDLTETDKKAYSDYLSVLTSNLSADSDLEANKKDAYSFIKAKYNEQVAKDAEKYLFGIEKEKTEKEKMMESIK
ncbi:MAG: hypothetical protein KA273_05450 [Bacteroidales bacterium]|nr:hypothetical protein [Bacteroidales bacterium]